MEVKLTTAHVVVACGNGLGECPIWDHFNDRLCWIDIDEKLFWTYDPETKQSASYVLPYRAGSFCLCKESMNNSGIYFFAFEKGCGYYNIYSKMDNNHKDDEFPLLIKYETDLQTRLNDGRVDRNGRFVFGGMCEPSINSSKNNDDHGYDYKQLKLQQISNVYRITKLSTNTMANKKSNLTKIDINTLNKEKRNYKSETLLHNISCTNSICFSKKGDIMYFTDTRYFPRRIDAYYYKNFSDAHGSSIKGVDGPSLWYKESPIRWNVQDGKFGGPDGSIIDNNDFLWNAQYGKGQVIRYNPRDGSIDFVVRVPNGPYCTCATFGGKNMDTLFITTKCNNMSQKSKEKYPKQCLGALYAVQVPFRGIKENVFGINTLNSKL